MIRRVQVNISEANKGKLETLDTLLAECLRVVNLFIDILWQQPKFSDKFVKCKVETWLSARLQQCLGKQALEIVKSQRKRKKKSKPILKKTSFTLDSRFVDIRFNANSFDIWIKLSSLGNRIILKLPARQHTHFHKFKGWTLRKSVRLRQSFGKYFVDLFFEKEAAPLRIEGKAIGIDVGYKKLIACSDGQIFGKELELLYEKISRKKQKSNAFKRALTERNNKINEIINSMPLKGVKTIVVEALKSVKHKSRGKIRKKFNNKLQRWIYPKVFGKLSRVCEEQGILFRNRDPAYTSQRCSLCGRIEKSNRKGEIYQCACGNCMDADVNAAVNILTWEHIVPMPIACNV